MALLHRLFGLRGRLNRAKFFPLFVLTEGAAIWLAYYVWLLPLRQMFKTGADYYINASHFFLMFVVCPIVTWSSVALQVKRIHDRNRSGILAIFVNMLVDTAISIVDQIGGGNGGEIEDRSLIAGNIDAFSRISPFSILCLSVSVTLTAWYLIELLFLRGTVGSNRFGSDPLNPS